MDCRTFRETIVTIRPADRKPSLSAQLQRHEGTCEDCAAFRRREEAVSAALAAAAEVAAPSGFTAQVMGRVDAGQAPPVSSWIDWFLGPLRAPTPGVSFAHVAAIAVVVAMLATAGFLVAHGGGLGPDLPATAAIASAGPASPLPAPPVIDKDSMDELVRRHQGSSVMQPLSDDEGMRLVSF